MSYRNDLDALEARHDALDAEVTHQTAERERTRALLAEARKKASLHCPESGRLRPDNLDNISVAAPCHASWDAMSGSDRVRHCGDCKKNVYNLSEMTREEAQALIGAHEGNLCVRYYRRSDGTILTQDCSVGVSKRRRRRLIVAAGATLLAAGAATVAVFAQVAHGGQHVTGMMVGATPPPHVTKIIEPPHVLMGQIKAPEPPAPPKPPVTAPSL